MRKLVVIASLVALLTPISLLLPSPASAHAQVIWCCQSTARGEINSSHTTAYACKLNGVIGYARVILHNNQPGGSWSAKTIDDYSNNGSCVSGSIPSWATHWRLCVGEGPLGNQCLADRPIT